MINIPLEQGLKLLVYLFKNGQEIKGYDQHSIRTRIETKFHNSGYPVLGQVMINIPLEQGLKQ